jgi:hypothetical protein
MWRRRLTKELENKTHVGGRRKTYKKERFQETGGMLTSIICPW